MKVFINVCYSEKITAPMQAPEDEIQKAIKGEESTYTVPMVVSELREDKDKGNVYSSFVNNVSIVEELGN